MAQEITNTNKLIRVLIVDDHPSVREGLRYRISSQPEMQVCGEASEMGEALVKIAESQPDVIIVDISLKDSDGLELIKAIQTRFEGARVLVHSMYEESIFADRCLRAGAMGYVNKESNPNDVIAALREIVAGRVYVSPGMADRMLARTSRRVDPQKDPVDTLTDRQLDVFRLMGQGRSAAEIAELLHISIHTVETHRENIKQKLDISSLPELTRLAVLWEADNRR